MGIIYIGLFSYTGQSISLVRLSLGTRRGGWPACGASLRASRKEGKAREREDCCSSRGRALPVFVAKPSGAEEYARRSLVGCSCGDVTVGTVGRRSMRWVASANSVGLNAVLVLATMLLNRGSALGCASSCDADAKHVAMLRKVGSVNV